MSALVAVSEGSLSSGGGKGSDRMYSFVLPVLPPSPQYLSLVPSLWQKILIGWFALQIVTSQILKLLYSQGYDNIYCII